MKITDEIAKSICKAHNDRVNEWLKNNVPEKFPASEWIRYAQLFDEQNFYEKGYRLLKALRKRGYDVKMNMQTNEIHYYGIL